MTNQVAYWERKPKSQKLFIQEECFDEDSRQQVVVSCVIHSTLESFSVSYDTVAPGSQLVQGNKLTVQPDSAETIVNTAAEMHDGIQQDIVDTLQRYSSTLDDSEESDEVTLITEISSDTTPVGTCFVNVVEGLCPYYEVGCVDHMKMVEGRTLVSGPKMMVRERGACILDNGSFIKGTFMAKIPPKLFDELYAKWKDAPYLLWNLIESLCDVFPIPKEMPVLEEPKRTLFPGDDEKRESAPAVINRGCLMWFSHTVRALTAEETKRRREFHLPLGNIECWMGLRALKNSISCSVNNESFFLYDEGFERTVERNDALAVYDNYRACFHEIVGIINSILASHKDPQVEIDPKAGECYWILDVITAEESCFKAIKVKSISSRGGLCFLKGSVVYCDMETIRVNKTQTLMTRATKLNPISEDVFTNLFDLANNRIIQINDMMANVRS